MTDYQYLQLKEMIKQNSFRKGFALKLGGFTLYGASFVLLGLAFGNAGTPSYNRYIIAASILLLLKMLTELILPDGSNQKLKQLEWLEEEWKKDSDTHTSMKDVECMKEFFS